MSIKNTLHHLAKWATGLCPDDLDKRPKTMFEIQQKMMAHKPTQEEIDEFKKNREEMEQWEFYHWYWGLGDKKYKVGDIVTRDGTDEHIIENVDYDCGLLGVRCTKEPHVFEGSSEPWTKVGEYESNLIRRYSLVRESVKNEGCCEKCGSDKVCISFQCCPHPIEWQNYHSDTCHTCPLCGGTVNNPYLQDND